jgi:hypothetical protein
MIVCQLLDNCAPRGIHPKADMSTESVDDPIFELRMYSVAPGRMEDMASRARQDLRKLLPRHGIHPLAAWTVDAGPGVPLFAYLTPWRRMQQRSRAWADFYADPAWLEARARTNAGSELVESFEVLFLREITGWTPRAEGGAPRLVELVVQATAVGQGAAVRQQILEAAVPALQTAGACVHGVFDVISGRPLPCAVFVIGWDSAAQRERALDHATVAPLLKRADRYLMRELPVAWEETQ